MRAPSQDIDFQQWYHRPMTTITVQSHPNIAFIKIYIGKTRLN